MAKILITGASQGIGFQVCKHALEQGHEVVCLNRSLGELKGVKSDKLHVYQLDINKASDSEIITIFKKHQPELLLNNAALLINQDWQELSKTDFIQMMELNAYAPLRLAQLSTKAEISLKHILNIGSMGGFQGAKKYPDIMGYSMTKGALHTLTECLSEALKEKGTSVNALALGAVQTEMLAKAFPNYKAPTEAIQMGAYILEFLLSGYAFFNGKILPVSNSNP
jgi:3-oxoacyl-[acyl-carrier protein] reductase